LSSTPKRLCLPVPTQGAFGERLDSPAWSKNLARSGGNRAHRSLPNEPNLTPYRGEAKRAILINRPYRLATQNSMRHFRDPCRLLTASRNFQTQNFFLIETP
jgi:hypothetical protein